MIYFALLVMNILFVYFFKSDNKYWLLSIPLWTLLILSFILWRINSDHHIQALEKEYWKNAENKEYGDSNKWGHLQQAEREGQKLNMTFIYCITLQTFVTFALQMAGRMRTKQEIYRYTRLIFGILFSLVILVIAMMGIVPSGLIT
jgi:hypothetical protein